MISKRAFSAISTGTVFAASVAIGLASFSAQATNKTANFLVSLTVQSDCSISATALPFGNATSALATTAITHNSSVIVTCSNGTTYSVALDKGTTTGSAVTARLLAGTGSNSQTVGYQLFSDVGLSAIWGDATGGAPVTGTGTGSAVPITVYGQVPAQPIPLADNYSSTETATITF